MYEQHRFAPYAVYLANAKLFKEHAQLCGHVTEAETDAVRVTVETKLVVLLEVELRRLSVDRDGSLEDEQVVEKSGVELTRRDLHSFLCHCGGRCSKYAILPLHGVPRPGCTPLRSKADDRVLQLQYIPHPDWKGGSTAVSWGLVLRVREYTYMVGVVLYVMKIFLFPMKGPGPLVRFLLQLCTHVKSLTTK